MRALIVDSLPPEAGFGLEALGLQVTEDASIGSHNLPEAVADAEILVVGATRVTRRALEAGKDLRLVIRAGSGVDTIDVAAASERGILVSHCGAAEAVARAELIIGMILALDRGVHLAHRKERAPALGLAGRSLGLFGFDATARRVREVARGLGLRVHVFDESMTATRASEAGVHRSASADALFSDSDIVSLHPPEGDTDVIATAERLARLGPQGTLINAARRGLIDLAAAKDALARGELKPGMRLIDSTSGNTGIAYAMVGAALGIPISLVMPKNVSVPRKQVTDAYGVELIYSSPFEGSDGAIRLVRELVAQHPDRYYYPDQYSNESNVLAHYDGTGVEIWEQTGGRVTHFVTGLGTSGTAMGTSRRLKSYSRAIRCVAIQPDDAMHGLEGMKHMPSSIVPEIYDEEILDDTIWMPTEEGWDMAEHLNELEGLFVGHSSGGNVAGALRLARSLSERGQPGVVVTILCDRGDRYFQPLKWEKHYVW
ncbi:MAG: pyridoxal-phosphate dependent enzyme [Myxococcales bacterium]|nr:pyridoxal-phosphate dependent enzyme [Myxococcales bacterium]